MSGHSKWATTKHKKGILDAKRGKLFTKVVREISSAVKQGGKNPDFNPRLRLAIQNAKSVSMPKENIDRAINKSDDVVYTNVIYEGNGQFGSAFIIECLTDNQNRTVGEIRTLFSRNGGALGKTGSVSYNFDIKSVFKISNNLIKDIDSFFLESIEYGIEDIDKNDEENILILSGDKTDFGKIQNYLEEKNIEILEAKIEYIAKTTLNLNNENYEKILNFIDNLEDLDDVQNVFHNIEIKD